MSPCTAENLTTFKILSHNISGGTFKLPLLNALLAGEAHEAITIQETWLKESVIDSEITNNTLYQINRLDRSHFDNHRLQGGGVITCFKNGTHIELPKDTLEIQATRIKVGRSFFVLINVYMPTYRTRYLLRSMIDSLTKSLDIITRKFPHDKVVLIGDFNMPKFKWQYTDDETNYLVNTSILLTDNERRFLTISSFGLCQINDIPNSHGSFLDLVFTNDPINISTRPAEAHEQFDNDSGHHSAIIVECRELLSTVAASYTNMNRIALKKNACNFNRHRRGADNS